MYANQDDLFGTMTTATTTTTTSSSTNTNTNYLSPVSPNSKKNNNNKSSTSTSSLSSLSGGGRGGGGPRRASSSRQSMSLGSRKSSNSLRTPSTSLSLGSSLGTNLAHSLALAAGGGESGSSINDDDGDGDSGGGGGGGGGGSRQHSLAHELAFALMPEPSAGSKLLAEEFGIEYDEGAEGIDESDVNGVGNGNRNEEEEGLLGETQMHALSNGVQDHMNGFGDDEVVNNGMGMRMGMGISFADELGGIGEEEESEDEEELGGRFGSPSPDKTSSQLEVFAEDLESTKRFLEHLRTLDSEAGLSTSNSTTSTFRALAMARSPTNQPVLERYASDIIRRMDESARNREGQLRELLECDRELKKIAGEVNGTEILSLVDELPSMNDDDYDGDEEFTSSTTLVTPSTVHSSGRTLETLTEEDDHIDGHNHHQNLNEWELEDPHALNREDEDISISPTTSPTKMSFSTFQPPPPMPHPSKVTPANTIPHLTHLRTFTSSLITSLTTLSEQAQVNGAGTTDAGRRIKSVKNKLGELHDDDESVEKSRVKIERWEAGILEWQTDRDEGMLGSVSPARLAARRRVNGRKLVEEHLAASEKAILEATERTRAIMAR